MITKFGIVGVGVLAGLAAVAPFASASESHGDHHGHGSSSCSVAGGEAGALSTINGDSAANGVVQAPVGGANALNVTCSKVLNDNLSGNTANVSILGGDVPFELPTFPSVPSF